MRLLRLLFPLILLGTFIACGKDKEGSLTVHFRANYDDSPLAMFVPKPYLTGEQIQFVHLSLLASDLWLLHSSDSHALKEIELVDMSFDNLTDANEGYTIRIDKIPADSYDGIRFGMGVPADLNAQEPSDFTSSHPLSRTGLYWHAWDSYIFMKVEGRLDSLGDGNFDTAFAYHTGSDDLYRILSTDLPITIESGKNTDISIVIDYKKLLEGINIKSDPQNHNPEDSIQIAVIINNLQDAVRILP